MLFIGNYHYYDDDDDDYIHSLSVTFSPAAASEHD